MNEEKVHKIIVRHLYQSRTGLPGTPGFKAGYTLEPFAEIDGIKVDLEKAGKIMENFKDKNVPFTACFSSEGSVMVYDDFLLECECERVSLEELEALIPTSKQLDKNPEENYKTISEPKRRIDTRLEKEFEEEFVKTVKSVGGFCWKVQPYKGCSGVPDRVVIFPDNKVGFVELKRPDGTQKPRPNQVEKLSQLKEMTNHVYVLDDPDEVDRLLEDIKFDKHPELRFRSKKAKNRK